MATVNKQNDSSRTLQGADAMPESGLLNFSGRTMRVLSRLGIQTYEEIDGMGRKEICRIRGCGQKTIDEIDDKMRELGYDW